MHCGFIRHTLQLVTEEYNFDLVNVFQGIKVKFILGEATKAQRGS
jgi:hypothetical protein